jgi:hypothetical protein
MSNIEKTYAINKQYTRYITDVKHYLSGMQNENKLVYYDHSWLPLSQELKLTSEYILPQQCELTIFTAQSILETVQLKLEDIQIIMNHTIPPCKYISGGSRIFRRHGETEHFTGYSITLSRQYHNPPETFLNEFPTNDNFIEIPFLKLNIYKIPLPIYKQFNSTFKNIMKKDDIYLSGTGLLLHHFIQTVADIDSDENILSIIRQKLYTDQLNKSERKDVYNDVLTCWRLFFRKLTAEYTRKQKIL